MTTPAAGGAPVFVDTSALYAVLDAGDERHEAAREVWHALLASENPLVTSNYVLLETWALVQHRLGVEAARALHAEVVPALEVVWLDEDLHGVAAAACLTAGRPRLSLVDCASFEVMRRLGLDTAFTLDHHFADQGFSVLPRGDAPAPLR